MQPRVGLRQADVHPDEFGMYGPIGGDVRGMHRTSPIGPRGCTHFGDVRFLRGDVRSAISASSEQNLRCAHITALAHHQVARDKALDKGSSGSAAIAAGCADLRWRHRRRIDGDQMR